MLRHSISWEPMRNLNLNNLGVFNESIGFLRNVSRSVIHAALGNNFAFGSKEGFDHLGKTFDAKVLQDLRNLAKIINTVGHKGRSPKDQEQNITVEELDTFFGLQDVVSNVFNLVTKDKWKTIQKDSSGSAKVVSVLNNWALRKLKETSFMGETIRLNKLTDAMGMQALKTSLQLFMSENGPYFWFPDYDKDKKWKELWKKWRGPQTRMRIPTSIFGERSESTEIQIISTLYDTYHRFAPLVNVITGKIFWLTFLDSRVIAFEAVPEYAKDVLVRDPIIIFHEHMQKRISIGRQLLAKDELIKIQPVVTRYCVRWDEQLKISRKFKGAWNTEGCSMVNSTGEITVCRCDSLGVFSLLAILEKPFEYPEHGMWLRVIKWILYTMSCFLLISYIGVVLVREPLHEHFHGVRANTCLAALGALTCFTCAEFVQPRDGLFTEECAILSGFSQYWTLSLGVWINMEAHALFSAVVAGVIGGRLLSYVLIAWGLPAIFVGANLGFYPDYGNDFRCLAGKTNNSKLTVFLPIILFGLVALFQSLMTMCNLSTPAIKRKIIVTEISHQNRSLCIISSSHIFVWLLAVFAYVDLGFDTTTNFEPIFTILYSSFGIFLVVLWFLGSKHFKASFLNTNSEENRKFYSLTWRLPSVELLRSLDPPDDSSNGSSSTGRSQNSNSSRS